MPTEDELKCPKFVAKYNNTKKQKLARSVQAIATTYGKSLEEVKTQMSDYVKFRKTVEQNYRDNIQNPTQTTRHDLYLYKDLAPHLLSYQILNNIGIAHIYDEQTFSIAALNE